MKNKPRFILSKRGNKFVLRRKIGDEVLLLFASPILYPRALVRALALAHGKPLCITVPLGDRVMPNLDITSVSNRRNICSVFGWGRYKSEAVEDLCKSDPSYLIRFYKTTKTRYHQPPYALRREVVDIKAWILYHFPGLATNVIGGQVFIQQQATRLLPELFANAN